MKTPLSVLILAALATSSVACFDKLISQSEPALDEIARANIIAVTASLPATGADTTTPVLVTALIPGAATMRTVTFTASSGFFPENRTKTVSVLATRSTADTSKLAATAWLRDSVAEHVVVRAAVGTAAAFYDTVGITFVKRP